jgi:hypothetical protein
MASLPKNVAACLKKRQAALDLLIPLIIVRAIEEKKMIISFSFQKVVISARKMNT